MSGDISVVRQTTWGYLAMHPGVTPSESIKRNENEKNENRSIIDSMTDNVLVIEQQEFTKKM